MIRAVVLTPTAEADLDAILSYIALDDPKTARRFVANLRRKSATLATMPERCAKAQEDGLDGLEIRHLLHGRYRTLFTIEPDRVVILQVRHGARLPQRRD